jgi:FlaA1/EpsC-like NDP-sugar epimerase
MDSTSTEIAYELRLATLVYAVYKPSLMSSKLLVFKVHKMSSCNARSNHRVAIIGVGEVGTAAANALILHSVTSELLIIDTNAALRNAQVSDLSDVSYICDSKTRVRAATNREAGQTDIVVITIGSKNFVGKGE